MAHSKTIHLATLIESGEVYCLWQARAWQDFENDREIPKSFMGGGKILDKFIWWICFLFIHLRYNNFTINKTAKQAIKGNLRKAFFSPV